MNVLKYLPYSRKLYAKLCGNLSNHSGEVAKFVHVPGLVEIGLVILKKSKMCKVYRQTDDKTGQG